MNRKVKLSPIPIHKEDSTWSFDPKAKQDAFARTFASKSVLPAEVIDTAFFDVSDVKFQNLVVFRCRACRRSLKKLYESEAIGHDKTSAQILKHLADCLAILSTRLCRRLFYEGCWSSAWKYHLIVPIFKKGAAFMPGNYRGVHLTTVLSKIAEEMISINLMPLL